MLSAAQKSDFWKKGVTLVESAYSPADLEPLRLQHQQAAASAMDRGIPAARRTLRGNA
jgi:hypothetical protein